MIVKVRWLNTEATLATDFLGDFGPSSDDEELALPVATAATRAAPPPRQGPPLPLACDPRRVGDNPAREGGSFGMPRGGVPFLLLGGNPAREGGAVDMPRGGVPLPRRGVLNIAREGGSLPLAASVGRRSRSVRLSGVRACSGSAVPDPVVSPNFSSSSR